MTFLPAGWILRNIVKFSRFIPLNKGHVSENLWKLSVTYLFEYINCYIEYIFQFILCKHYICFINL